jgi:hypothetical protein
MRTTILALVLGSGLALAAGEATYKGVDSKTKKECVLKVEKTYHSGNTGNWVDFRADASTSYSHDSASPGTVTVSPSSEGGKDLKKYLKGKNSDDTTLEVTLKTDEDFTSPDFYRIVWKHGNHSHTNKCINLKLHSNP